MSEFTLVVASKNYSSWSLRAYLALAHTGQPFREVLIALDEPTTAAEIARYSPTGNVPVLQHGALTVWDSLAICEYLAETFPQARLWPEDKTARAVARSATAEMHSGFSALRRNMPMNLHARKPGHGRAPGVADDITRVQKVWNECRQRFGQGGPYLFGHFTIADAFYAPVVTRFVTYEVQLDEVSRAYRDTVLALPSFKTWLEAARHEPPVKRYL
ncbi:MAG TPA: glutathione S-transferase family protein [Myxococcaceae bacterium]|nr:glutathione S-transferase family protein [Myxococcaceae bacterium]